MPDPVAEEVWPVDSEAWSRIEALVGRIDERLKIIERVVYGAAGMMLGSIVLALLSLVLRSPGFGR